MAVYGVGTRPLESLLFHFNCQPSRQRVRININRSLVHVIDDLNHGSTTGDIPMMMGMQTWLIVKLFHSYGQSGN
jgi:hypothetical protein